MGITEEIRHTAAKLLNAGRFAVGSAVSQVGLHVYYDMVKGEWKGEPSSDSDVKKNLVMVEEMKRQQDMNSTQQQRRTGDDDDRLKRLFEEPLIDSSNSNNATPPKIFIRSRL